jgi:hypothetical protein
MMGLLPFSGDHRPVPYFNDEIANSESGLFGHPHEVAVGPLGFVVIHHVRDLGKE